MSTHPALTKLNLKKHLYSQSTQQPVHHDGLAELTLVGTTARQQPAANTGTYDVHKYDSDNNIGESTDTLLTTRTEVPRVTPPAATPGNTLKSALNDSKLDNKQHRPAVRASSKYDNVKSKLFESTQLLKLRAEAMKQPEHTDTYKSHKSPAANKRTVKQAVKPQNDVDAVVSRFYKLIDAQDSEHKDADESVTLPQLPTVDPAQSLDYDKHAEMINQSMAELQRKKLQLEHKRHQANIRTHYNAILQQTSEQYEHELQVQLIALQQSKQQTYAELNTLKQQLNDKIKQLQQQVAEVEQQTYRVDTQYKQCVSECKQQYSATVKQLSADVEAQVSREVQKLAAQYDSVLAAHGSVKLNNANGVT